MLNLSSQEILPHNEFKLIPHISNTTCNPQHPYSDKHVRLPICLGVSTSNHSKTSSSTWACAFPSDSSQTLTRISPFSSKKSAGAGKSRGIKTAHKFTTATLSQAEPQRPCMRLDSGDSQTSHRPSQSFQTGTATTEISPLCLIILCLFSQESRRKSNLKNQLPTNTMKKGLLHAPG